MAWSLWIQGSDANRICSCFKQTFELTTPFLGSFYTVIPGVIIQSYFGLVTCHRTGFRFIGGWIPANVNYTTLLRDNVLQQRRARSPCIRRHVNRKQRLRVLLKEPACKFCLRGARDGAVMRALASH